MQTAFFLEKTGAERLCQHILGLDSAILFVGICSVAGEEISSASKPSASLMIGMAPKLRDTYSAGVSSVTNSFKQGEPLLGELLEITASYKKLKIMIIYLGEATNAVAVLATTKELDSKNVTFQVTRVTRNFVGS
jgi:hypothetical protein